MPSVLEAMMMGERIGGGISENRRRRNEETMMRLVGGQLGKGDYQGAASQLLGAGNLEGGLSVMSAGREQQQMSQAQAREAGQFYYQALTQLRGMPPAQRAQVAPQMAQRLGQFGIEIPQEALSRVTDDAALDSELASLAPMFAQPQEFEIGTIDGRGYAADPRTGEFRFADPGMSSAGREELEFRRAQYADERADAAAPDFSREQSLRKEWTSVTSDFEEVARNYANIEQLATREDSASDLALIVAFTKVLDPGSVAREGEVNLTQQAAGLFQNASVWMRRLQDGRTLLPDEVREAYVAAAGDIYGQVRQSYDRRRDEYSQIAEAEGLDPSRTLLDFTAPGVAGANTGGVGVQAGPVIGDIEEGYEYLGGDPADPNSWREAAQPNAWRESAIGRR